ncbi:MAG: lysophospholipid acyltransferase family protein [Acidobacteriota bacterium]
MRSIPALSADLTAAVAGLLPRPMVLTAGRRLGDLTSLLARKRRSIALKNLLLALGRELTEAQQRRIMRQSFRQLGQNVLESFLLPGMLASGLERYAEIEGWHHLQEAVAAGRGAIVFTGHFGNWELVALAQGARGIPMDVVGRPLGDRHLNRRLERMRQLTGNGVISKHDAFRPMLKSLRNGRTVGLVIDQNVGGGHGVFVDFFGRKASTTPALALLALKTGVSVLPVFGYPEGRRHRIVYGPPVSIHRTGGQKEDVLRLTAAVTRIIEDQVRLHPHLWLWMHNRWRSRPDHENQGGASDPSSFSRRLQPDGLDPTTRHSSPSHS